MITLQGTDEQTLSMIYLLIVFIIPGIVLWFDDGEVHSGGKA